MIYLLLFWEFLKVGVFAIGGGMMTLPFLYDISDRLAWFDRADIVNIVAVSVAAPGPIGINMVTYAGYHVAGIAGGLIAALSLALPAIIITLIVAGFLSKFSENRYVQWVFYGLQPAIVGLVASVCIDLLKISVVPADRFKASGYLGDLINIKALILFAVLYFAISRYKRHPFFYIAAAAIVGMIFGF